jgi:hypothetical protein
MRLQAGPADAPLRGFLVIDTSGIFTTQRRGCQKKSRRLEANFLS